MLEVTTTHYLVLSFVLFAIGLFGIAARRNMITVLMSIELVLNSVNLNLIAFSYQLSDLTGQIFAIFTITVAAGEAAVGLGILIALFRLRETTPSRRGHGAQGMKPPDLAHPGSALPGSAAQRRRPPGADQQAGGGRDRLRRHRHRGGARPSASIFDYTGDPAFSGGEGWLPFEHDYYVWMPAGPIHTVVDGVRDFDIPFGFLLDPLSGVMLFVVTFVGFLIHVYSVGYMAHDDGLSSATSPT